MDTISPSIYLRIRLPKPDILIIRANNTSRKANLVILIVISTILVTGIFTADIPTAVFADSRLIRQDTKQAANCDTVGAASPVSNSCNQRGANNVNNGVPTAVQLLRNLQELY